MRTAGQGQGRKAGWVKCIADAWVTARQRICAALRVLVSLQAPCAALPSTPTNIHLTLLRQTPHTSRTPLPHSRPSTFAHLP